MKRALDWLLTLPFLVAFGAVLLVFDPLQRIARLFGQRPQEVIAGLLQVSLVAAVRLCGTHIQVERAGGLVPGQPYLLLANHQSLFDIPILGSVLFRHYPKYVAKVELARWLPSISYNLRRGGNAIIDRKDRAQATQTIRDLAARIERRGVSAVIYPEGTRSRRGELRPFKPKGTLAFLEAAPRAEVVPVTIDGSWLLLRHNLLPVPFGTRIRLRVGAPLARQAGEDGAALLKRARDEIESTLTRWRGAGAGHPGPGS